MYSYNLKVLELMSITCYDDMCLRHAQNVWKKMICAILCGPTDIYLTYGMMYVGISSSTATRSGIPQNMLHAKKPVWLGGILNCLSTTLAIT